MVDTPTAESWNPKGIRSGSSIILHYSHSGLLHALLNVTDKKSLLYQPWVGASWEGFVIQETIGCLCSLVRKFEAFYFRTSDRHEVDLVLDFGTELWAVETKLTSSPRSVDMNKLEQGADLIGASKRFLVSQTRRPSGGKERASLNLSGFVDRRGEA